MDCCGDIEWYNHIKDNQASVEVTSYGQMEAIIEYGSYTIGIKQPIICKSQVEVISLNLNVSEEHREKHFKANYTLEELQDLESKLVLITARDAEHRGMVDLFVDTFHSVRRIAELLITLQQFGNVKYTGWIMVIPCSSENLIDILQFQAKAMEKELLEWKNIVNHTRREFYELNYYTTVQLLTLRRELSTEKEGYTDIAPNVLFLLQSISRKVVSRGVRELVRNVVAPTASNPFIPKPNIQAVTEDVISINRFKAETVVSSAIEDSCEDVSRHSDMPELTENDLTNEKREILEYVIRAINCSKFLVLKAFELCQGEDMDKYDYRKWCFEKLDEFDFDDEEASDTDEEYVEDDLASSHSESENEHEELFINPTGSCQADEANLQINSTFHDIVTVESKVQEHVDKDHPIVQDLLSAGYPLDQSITAVQEYGTLAAAMAYLDGEEAEGISDLMQISISSSDHQTSMDKQLDGPTIYADSKAEDRYLSLEQLGKVLKILSQRLPGEVQQQRSFSFQFLKVGSPNLLVVAPDLILRSTLSLYMGDTYLPLPTPEEVLVCNSSTTAEEVELFWMRAITDPGFKRLFCLVHAEKLPYQVSDQALHSLLLSCQGKKGYRLVIMCSNEEEEKSHFISKLYQFRRPYTPRIDLNEYKDYLSLHFTSTTHEVDETTFQVDTVAAASIVDFEQSRVRFISSTRSGMGKSLYIKYLAKKHESAPHVIVPLHGPVVTPETVLELFKEHVKNPPCCIYHIDVAPSVLWQVDTILFSLLVLRGLCDNQGRVWRCHPNQLYAIEVTIPNREILDADFPESRTISLIELMPYVSCLSPCKAFDYMDAEISSNSLVVMNTREFKSESFQRVYQYIRRFRAGKNLDNFSFNKNAEGYVEDCLEVLLEFCGISDPSWSEINHFVGFLDNQLKSCEKSVYTDLENIGDVMAGLKGFVVKFMIRMSTDFSTSSLHGEVSRGNEVDNSDDIDKYQISERKQWEQSTHPYIFFNDDRTSITFVGFTVTADGDLLNPVDGTKLEPTIMTPKLYTGLKQNKVNFEDDYRKWTKSQMIESLSKVMGVKYSKDPDESYVLTFDNIIKILAIQMRFRCNIPVVIMGETGCGKTRLIRYMCDLARQGKDNNNMLILKVHGGISEEDVHDFIVQAEKKSRENRDEGLYTVVFFDEANTTDAIGLIKEIMCDRRINGKPVSDDLKFIAACNPYRKHSDKMIERLESAGLGFFVEADETQHKLGKIPLRQLVYRVLDLPPSMRPLVYDFGQLNTETESDYIKHIVYHHICCHPQLKEQVEELSGPIANVLAYSQKYMREREDECSFVSLRDVERAMIVFEYLLSMMDMFGPEIDKYSSGEVKLIDSKEQRAGDYQFPGMVARALTLAINVCYDARLINRDEFEEGVVKCFTGPIFLADGLKQFRNEIRWCQEVLLDNMQFGDNIARNAALRENVFMMTICIELKIPLFLVGKPGSSKSLAKSIVTESMKGKYSKKHLLKKFKKVQIFSYQCSQLSTPESVIEVFNNASKFQANQDRDSNVAVVVLDEVGLAEDSPNLPLKALHPLLEDGTEGAKKDFTDEIISRQERVAFIGISNWALDPAKMNRGVMVTRADPSEDELVFSAKGICSNKKDDPVREILQPYFQPFARAYKTICDKQEREFFGLRDFYSLIKMLYSMCQESQDSPTWSQLVHAIKRNFGGLETDCLNPFEEFKSVITTYRIVNIADVPRKLHPILFPDCSRLGLIKISLSPKIESWHGENRYVLFLTENYAALDILKNPKNYLEEGLSISKPNGGAVDVEPFILFGSSFPKDKEYTQVCRNINQIKICMETGRTVILLNLENLYESLYDVLNQYYIVHYHNKYVDLGLQTHRVKCRVDDNFRLILIAEKDTVYDKFPTPLINRLEKHFVLTSSILKSWQELLLNVLIDWINKFCSPYNTKFKKADAFIGFQKDTPASVVFQASNLLRSAISAVKARENVVAGGKWERILQWCEIGSSSWNIQEEQSNGIWSNAVLKLSKYLLLLTASPDAVVRLEQTVLADEVKDIKQIYFDRQHHESIEDFLDYNLNYCSHQEGALLMQVTTPCHLLSQIDLRDLQTNLQIKIAAFFLHEFDTELDFSNKVGQMFKTSEDQGPEKCLVVIQCDAGHLNGDLIACARYRIYDLRAKADEFQTTHVLFIIHLPQQVASSSFVGFQGEPWISSHIDDLRKPSDTVVSTKEAIRLTISELFLGRQNPKTLLAIAKERDTGAVLCESDDDEFFDARENWEDSDFENDEEETVNDMDSEDSVEFYDAGDEETNNEEGNAEEKGTISTAESLTLLHEAVGNIPEELPSFRSPLFRRLHSCIQAATSRLKDFGIKRSTKRVEILVHLIPKEIPAVPDETQFHGLLINHIFKVLQERDQTKEGEKDWVIKEAMNSRSLQYGGTFRNALSRKVDEVIVPIFSELIASIDQNYNLDLIDPVRNDPLLAQFWISMFRECGILQFSYTDMITPREQVPGVGGRKGGDDYKCELPFSWLIYEALDGQLENARSSSGAGKHAFHKQLCDAMEPTVVGEVLRSVEDHNSEVFYKRYLHDFVRVVHRSKHGNKHTEKEYELLSGVLDALVQGEKYCSMDNGGVTLIHRIAALHVVYEMNRSQVMWFGELVTLFPEVMFYLHMDIVCHGDEMILHLRAVEQALVTLEPPLDKDDPANSLVPWLNEVHLAQNAINSIISLASKSVIKVEARLKWGKIRALLLFLEHVLLKNPFEQSVAYMNRLRLCFDTHGNFLESSTLEALQKQLKSIYKQVKNRNYLKGSKLANFQRDCRNYLIEVVSNLCFGDQNKPKPDLIKKLVEMMLDEEQQGDRVSVIKSSLLQLLLEHNSDSTKTHLEEYFTKSQETPNAQGNEGLYLLCIQCFEDAFYKQQSEVSPESKFKKTTDKLTTSCNVLRKYHSSPIITISYLEAIARIRFVTPDIASFLNSDDFATKPRLVQQLKDVYTDSAINSASCESDAFGPSVYLLKVLLRQHGFSSVNRVFKRYPWVIPKFLSSVDQKNSLDPFLMYHSSYLHVRDLLKEIPYKNDKLHELNAVTTGFDVQNAAVFLLAVYEAVTLGYSNPQIPIDTKLFKKAAFNIKALSPQMLQIAENLISNQQGGPLAQMKVSMDNSSENTILATIVVHTVSVLSTCSSNPLLLLLVNMLTDPAALSNSYLPAMSEDRDVIATKESEIYECLNGHRYLSSRESDLAEDAEINCTECGSVVIKSTKIDNTGHTLISPCARIAPLVAERSLSPSAICIMRALMHSAFLWCSCHCQDAVASELATLVKARACNPNKLPEFFWEHLCKDVEHLSRVTEKGLNESAIMIHLVLHGVLTKKSPVCEAVAALKDEYSREEWEKKFSLHYIEPIVNKMEACISDVKDQIAKDFQQGHDKLLCLGYERTRVRDDNLQPHFWSYRQRITLEHLRQTLADANVKNKYPILDEFLNKEHSLRATQYLPDIVKLQRSLYDTYHLRKDRRKDDEKKTIGQFLKNYDNSRRYGDKFLSLQKALALVGNHLRAHAPVPLEDEHCLTVITKDMPLKYLIPTDTGAGALTVCLVDYLIHAHNNFIDKCTSCEVLEEIKSSWDRHKIPIAHIHRCHLLDYENQIVSVVLSHCSYSLRVGEAHVVQYDHLALEKHILDKFIHGKPKILTDGSQVVCRDTYTTATREAVRKRINPQVRLEPRVQKEIVSDLHASDRLRENLDVVDIVIGFVSSGGGKPEKPLGEYVDRVLKMRGSLSSKKIRQYCQLQHILSLWELLSMELAKLACEKEQEPFDMGSLKCSDLKEDQKSHLEKCLKKLDLDKLLGALYEFIEIHAKYSTQTEFDEHLLKDTISLDKFEHLDVKSQLSEFPSSITLSQTVAVWKHVAQYQKNLKKNNYA